MFYRKYELSYKSKKFLKSQFGFKPEVMIKNANKKDTSKEEFLKVSIFFV